jgi:hypothetical protein
MNYRNKYGQATLTPVTDVLHISAISASKMPGLISQVQLSIEEAEQLALITENRHIQITYSMETKQFYVVHHVTANTVQLCQATIDYKAHPHMSPATIIQNLRSDHHAI